MFGYLSGGNKLIGKWIYNKKLVGAYLLSWIERSGNLAVYLAPCMKARPCHPRIITMTLSLYELKGVILKRKPLTGKRIYCRYTYTMADFGICTSNLLQILLTWWLHDKLVFMKRFFVALRNIGDLHYIYI